MFANLNVDIIFKIAQAGFMRIGKLTYIATKAKKAIFIETDFTRSNILFIEGD